MITGDKQETAVNIGRSCKLVSAKATLLVAESLTDQNCEHVLRDLCNRAKELEDSVLVINGASTHVAVNQHAKLFMELVQNVRSIICCQVTPLQKAQIVACVKANTKYVCLSIGDGANDVSMIQTADIGIGIFGREGTQAARASDYAIR
jgi:magnesium-transporting ATPase (P-type)